MVLYVLGLGILDWATIHGCITCICLISRNMLIRRLLVLIANETAQCLSLASKSLSYSDLPFCKLYKDLQFNSVAYSSDIPRCKT